MPSHLYVSPHVPPRLWDIVLGHSMEIAVALYSTIIGFVVVINAQSYEPDDGGILYRLPLFLVYAIGIFVGAGGATALCGLLVRRSNVRIELNVEQIGWIVLSVGWFAYLYAAFRYGGGPNSAVVSGFCISLGGFFRVLALFALERDLDKTMTEKAEGRTNPGEETHGHR